MTDTQQSYIGRLPCGCINCAAAQGMSGVFQELAQWERRGLKVELVPDDVVRAELWVCRRDPAGKATAFRLCKEKRHAPDEPTQLELDL